MYLAGNTLSRFAIGAQVRRALPVVCVIGLGVSSLSAAGPVSSTPLLKTTTTWDGTPIRFTGSTHPEVQSLIVEVPPGGATAWHKHPVNNFAYMLQGQIRVELAGQSTSHEFKAGEAFAEVVDTWHRGVNTGSVPTKILVFYAGETAVPISITQPVPAASDAPPTSAQPPTSPGRAAHPH